MKKDLKNGSNNQQSKSTADRVKRLINREKNKAEIFIARIKLFIILLLGILYIVAPKAFQGTVQVNLTLTVIFVYLPLLILQVFLAQRHLLRDWSITLFTVLDFVMLGILIFTFHLQYQQSALFYLKSPTFVYMFLFITIQSLRFETKYVILSGVSAIVVWSLLFSYALVQNAEQITHSYIEYINQGALLIGAELDKLIILSLFTAVMAKGVRNGQDLRRRSIDYYVRTEEQTKRKNLQLYFEKEKAEQANQTKSRFLDIISHELKTPLNGILGIVQLLKLDNENKKELNQIMESGELLLSHISRILRFTEIEIHTETKTEHSVDVESALQEVIDFYRSTKLELKNELTTALKNKVSADIDRQKLTDIVFELISNADKNSNGSEIKLDAVIQTSSNGEKELVVVVKDDGVGMDEKQLNMAMGLFSQTQDPKTRSEGGIGLGLPLARQLAATMDSTIEIESKPNQGTTVFLKIPQ